MTADRRASGLRPVRTRARVLIAGAGVAALEAVLALRHLAGRGFDLQLAAPAPAFVNRPASVASPFGLDAPGPLPLGELAERYGVRLLGGMLTGVDVERRTADLADVGEVPYDWLLIAVGTRPLEAIPGAVAFHGPADAPAVERALAEVRERGSGHLVIAVPTVQTWSLPAYELAAMAATRLPRAARITVVTAERAPLWLFGDAASQALAELLQARGVTVLTDVRPSHVDARSLHLAGGGTTPADAVIALPELEGPRISGVPADGAGFIPVDAHGRVPDADRVLAAGDATTFPVKQGGLATQQADAAAEAIAADLGAPVTPRPFEPVLRGVLLTGGAPLYLRAELDRRGARRSATARPAAMASIASTRALWWPPGKIAGRYLAPYLATARPVSLGDEPLVDRVPVADRRDHADAEAALELVLALAAEEAAAGDLGQALHALDAAAALTGGVLPDPYGRHRDRWRAELSVPLHARVTNP